MPFHIKYSGLAPISTYFRVNACVPRVGLQTGVASESHDRVSDTAVSPTAAVPAKNARSEVTETIDTMETNPSSATGSLLSGSPPREERIVDKEERFVAAFRGRTVHGLRVDLPEGYGGIILRTAEDASGSASGAPTSDVQGKATMNYTEKGAADGRGTRRRAASNYGKIENAKFSDGSCGMEVDEAEDEIDPEGRVSNRTLKPTETFTSFVLWQPDYPVDEGKDEYYRSLTEWTQLAAQIHQYEE